MTSEECGRSLTLQQQLPWNVHTSGWAHSFTLAAHKQLVSQARFYFHEHNGVLKPQTADSPVKSLRSPTSPSLIMTQLSSQTTGRPAYELLVHSYCLVKLFLLFFFQDVKSCNDFQHYFICPMECRRPRPPHYNKFHKMHYLYMEAVILMWMYFWILKSLPWHVLCHISLLQGGADNPVNRRAKVKGRGGRRLWGARDALKVNQRMAHRSLTHRWW